MKKNDLKRILIISLIIVTSSALLIPFTANNKDEVGNSKFGLPFYFIEQQSTYVVPQEGYPHRYFIKNPLKYPTDYIIPYFLISYILVTFYTGVIYHTFKLLKNKIKDK